MWGYGYAPYETVEEKQEKAQAMIQRLQKKGQTLSPIPSGIKLGATWLGRAWNQNLERYADYINRLGRGKTYVRNGFVIDLYMEKGEVSALVAGSSKSPYHVEIIIDPIKPSAWKTIKETVGRRIDSVEALVAGSFPKELGDVLFGSLFPTPKEIHFSCSCPDGAWMCKHVAAVLYGVGAKLDQDPRLFFTLRDIDTDDLIKTSVEERTKMLLKNARKKSDRELSPQETQRLFGI
jgi:uncharacterized Zn finger protein